MHKVRLKGVDDNFNDIIKPWKNVYSDFKTHFVGWQILSDEMRKKLTRRLAKAYSEESNSLKTSEEKYGKESVAENYISDLRQAYMGSAIRCAYSVDRDGGFGITCNIDG
jgi:hypothetical protein